MQLLLLTLPLSPLSLLPIRPLLPLTALLLPPVPLLMPLPRLRLRVRLLRMRLQRLRLTVLLLPRRRSKSVDRYCLELNGSKKPGQDVWPVRAFAFWKGQL